MPIRGSKRLRGFGYGLSQPPLVVALNLEALPRLEALAARFLDALDGHMPLRRPAPTDTGAAPEASLLAALAAAAAGIQRAAGLPAADAHAEGRARLGEGANGHGWALALPDFRGGAEPAVGWACAVLQALADAPQRTRLMPAEAESLERLYETLGAQGARGTNERHFVEAAFALDLPVLTLPGGVLQFGWGAAARRFRSSIGDATSSLGVSLARDKALTVALLRQAGLPVPMQMPAPDLAGALAAARRIGYPVVLKARDLEQGAAVVPGLRTPAALERAFAGVAAHGRPMVVERHIPGRDYRINVLDGRAVGAVERVPGGVTGDGVRTVAELVAETNRDPRRSARRFSVMKPLALDAEAAAMLAEAGLDAGAVPDAGRFVALRRTANVTTGGHTVAVNDRIHPENARLCEAAVRQLGLDIAGVDLIVPDIARSWRETGGGICEVNAAPQIGLTYPGIFRRILSGAVPGDGRVPVGLVLAPGEAVGLPRGVAQRLSRQGLSTGLSTAGGQAIDGRALNGVRTDAVEGARTLALQRDLRAAVIAVPATEVQRLGLPVDRLSALACLEQPKDPAALAAALRALAPHLCGPCLTLAGTRAERAAVSAFGVARVRSFADAGRLEAAMAEALAPSVAPAVTDSAVSAA